MPGLDEKKAAAKEGQPLRFRRGGGGRCTGSRASADEALFVAYLVDDTVLKNRADEYLAARPAVLLIAVDTYDEVLKEMKDSDRARIAGEVDYALEQFVARPQAFCAALPPRAMWLWWKNAISARSSPRAFPFWIQGARHWGRAGHSDAFPSVWAAAARHCARAW